MIVEVKLKHKEKLYRVAVRSAQVSSAGAVALLQLPMFWKPENVTIINCVGYCHCLPQTWVLNCNQRMTNKHTK